jgi:hypothetical protein
MTLAECNEIDLWVGQKVLYTPLRWEGKITFLNFPEDKVDILWESDDEVCTLPKKSMDNVILLDSRFSI